MLGILIFVKNNLGHVAPLLIVGAFAIAIVLERMQALMITYPFSQFDAFFERVKYLVMADRLQEAMGLCDRFGGHKPTVQVVREGLLRAHQPDSIIEHGLQIVVGEFTEKIQARTAFLATVANVATLLGLLGTILGLIQSFEAVGSASAQERAALLANGISTAMNATMLGLAIAIPCMIAYSYLIARTNRLTGQMERAAIQTLDLLKQRQYAAPSEAPRSHGEYAGRPMNEARLEVA